MSDSRQAEIEWAHTYSGYERLAGEPRRLEVLLAGAREEYRREGVVPEWCGVDLLRGWAFYLVRADRFAGGDTLGAEWDAVLRAVRDHPAARPDDAPPDRLPDLATLPLPTRHSLQPRMHGEGMFLAEKRTRWFEPHVAPVNRFVDRIRTERGTDHVPYVDPDSGGIAARVLLVMESPGRKALESGMLSADNNDATAENLWTALATIGLARTSVLPWNVVPWYVGTPKKNASVVIAQALKGQPYLLRLLDLLPDLRVVVAIGRWAQLGVELSAETLRDRGITVVEAPHPSPVPARTSHGESLRRFAVKLAEARDLAGDAAVPATRQET